jgi:hypothetical protein
MERYVKFVPQPERVLRLDTERFATHMRHILAQVISNDAICAPFKQNWVSHMRSAKH